MKDHILGLVVDALRYGDEPVEDNLDTTDELVKALHAAQQIVAAAQQVRDHLKGRIAEKVTERGDFRYGDLVYRVSPKSDRKVIDGRALLEWLGDDLISAVPASAVRITSVRAIAQSRDLEPRTVEDTFFETIWGEPALAEVPISKAPKFLQDMEQGHRERK